jgi:TolB-like protein/Tfp pilus assembly protein PilF
MLYEMTTGQLPFTGPTGTEVLRAIQRARPQPVHDLLPQVPLELDRIVQKAMAPRRGDRYQDVEDLAVDLKRLGRELESGSSPSYEALQGLTDQRVRRAPRWVVPTLLGLVVVAVLALAVFWPGRGLEEPTPVSETIPTARAEVASIAVLPFADMSPGKDQEYFADGLSEELLNALVKIRDLRVAGRTSSFSFKGKNVTISDIGRELNVATVLEGSVRKAGNQVRITAQLVKVEDGFQLWSETYDRELSDIFAVQDEIARSVAGELQVRLTRGGQEASISLTRIDPGAYTAYLQGQHFSDLGTEADLWKAVGYFEEALDLAPDYALAWAGLARAHLSLTGSGLVPVDEGHTEARKAVNRALELDDDLTEAQLWLAALIMRHERDWAGAEVALNRALELEPGNAAVISTAADFAMAMGRFDEAVVLDRRAVQFDPLSPDAHRQHGLHAQRAGLPEEALVSSRRAVELEPNAPLVHTWLGLVHLDQGRAEAALAEFDREVIPLWRPYGRALAYHALGRQEEADRALAELIEGWEETMACQIAEVYAFRGETDRAFEWLERAYAQRDSGLAFLNLYPGFGNLHDDPRWKAFLKKMGLPV